MFVYIPGKAEEKIIVLDTEYSEQKIIQFSALILQKTEFNPSIYQLVSSANVFIKPLEPISYFTTKYTGLTNGFLNQHGLSQDEFQEFIQEFLVLVDSDAVIVAHGIRNDISVLRGAGIDFQCKFDCTLEMAKKILKKEKNLKLTDIAEDAGLILNFAHNSYSDALATLSVYSFLKTLEMEAKKWNF